MTRLPSRSAVQTAASAAEPAEIDSRRVINQNQKGSRLDIYVQREPAERNQNLTLLEIDGRRAESSKRIAAPVYWRGYPFA